MSHERLSWRGRLAISIVTLGGFLFGFYAVVITGALCFMTKHLCFTSLHEATIVSILLLGACVGGAVSGSLADRIGRKWTIALSGFFFLGGAVFFVFCSNFYFLMLGRVLGGLAIGLISLAVPLYLAEIAPARSRGKIVAMNTLAIALGIFFAYCVNYIFAETEDWRMMFSVGIIPAVLLCGAIFFLPETPAWLLGHRGVESARKSFRSLRQDKLWESHLGGSTHEESGSYAKLFSPSLRYPLILGVALHLFQQITGINGILYFAPKIFESAGFDIASTAVLATMGVGAVNLLTTLVFLKYIDRKGRRPLLLIGTLGMALSLIGLSTAFYFETSLIGPLAVVLLLAYVMFFALGLGPIPWLFTSEIYPLSVRGKAIGIATVVNWFSSFVIAQIFIGMTHFFGTEGTFFLFAALSLLALFFIYQYVPETSGKSLEEIASSMKRRK